MKAIHWDHLHVVVIFLHETTLFHVETYDIKPFVIIVFFAHVHTFTDNENEMNRALGHLCAHIG